ncbi:MAG TPA: shikimate kinase [Terriglobales bacterium]|nr:shikimate kinase [Terriglobales bacterium]
MTRRPGAQPDAGGPALRSAGVRPIFLVGFMGAGKSTVGQALGNLLGWPFEDLDNRVEAREGRAIERIFAESGEPEFRRAEREALAELLAEADGSSRVVALGGGAFVQAENAALISQSGALVVFLDGTADELYERCRQGQPERPLRRSLEHFRQLYAARRPHYLKAALHVETGGKDIETVAAEVASKLGLR